MVWESNLIYKSGVSVYVLHTILDVSSNLNQTLYNSQSGYILLGLGILVPLEVGVAKNANIIIYWFPRSLKINGITRYIWCLI